MNVISTSRQWGFIKIANVAIAILTLIFATGLSAQEAENNEDIQQPSCIEAANQLAQEKVLTLAKDILTVDGIIILNDTEPGTYIYNPKQTAEEREADIQNNLLVHNDMLYSLTAIISIEVAVERGIPEDERAIPAGFLIVRCGPNDSKEAIDSWWQFSLFAKP